MVCCQDMDRAMDFGSVAETEKHLIRDGRLMNEVDSNFFLRFLDDTGRYIYLGLNYCPFCGRPLSRGLWMAEKKK